VDARVGVKMVLWLLRQRLVWPQPDRRQQDAFARVLQVVAGAAGPERLETV
jgi:hypothetical protein